MIKKQNVFGFLKQWWPLGALLGGLIAFGANVQAVWNAPKEIKKVEEEVSELDKAMIKQTAMYEAQQEMNATVIEILKKKK